MNLFSRFIRVNSSKRRFSVHNAQATKERKSPVNKPPFAPEKFSKRELFEETGICADELTEVGRVVDKECHSAYVEYLCVTDCDKNSVKLQEGDTSDYRWVDKITLLNMKRTS